MKENHIYQGNAIEILKQLDDKSVNCCVTSPPYWGLRHYQVDEQLGLEKTPEEYVQKMVEIFREVKRILKKDGTLWLNLGDSYSSGGRGENEKNNSFLGNGQGQAMSLGAKTTPGLKPKNLVGIPWRVALALQADGWYLRQDIIWAKSNPMPESVKDRCTKSHEYIFLLSKSKNYYFAYEAIQEEATGFDGRKDTKMKGSEKYKNSVVPGKKEHTMASQGHERWKFKKHKSAITPGQKPQGKALKRMNGEIDPVYPVRNKRSVWTVPTKPFKEAHFAVFPVNLIKDCIKAGCPENGIVLDPFFGSGTTGETALRLNRKFVGIELNKEYIEIAEKRLNPFLHNLFSYAGAW